MTTFVLIIHILVCFGLIGIVLLQSGKGAELGAAFGGSSQTLFGSRGAATFLNKMTTVIAVVFMLTSLALAVLTIRAGSVVEKTPVTEETNIPATSGPVQEKGAGPIQPSEKKGQLQPQTQQKQQPQPQQLPKQQVPQTPAKK
jgi:preprotein translocase subunit SecG